MSETREEQEHGRNRSLIELYPDIIFFKDLDGVYLDCNPAFRNWLAGPGNRSWGALTRTSSERRSGTDFGPMT